MRWLYPTPLSFPWQVRKEMTCHEGKNEGKGLNVDLDIGLTFKNKRKRIPGDQAHPRVTTGRNQASFCR